MKSSVVISFRHFLDYLQTYLKNSTELTTHRCAQAKFLECVSLPDPKKLAVTHLRKFRDHMIAQGLARKTIREYLHRIIRWVGFCWEQGKVSQATYLACKSMWMPNPRQGRPPVRTKSVTWLQIAELLPHLPTYLSNLIQLHWLTAARPCEIVQINSNNFSKVKPDLWIWVLPDHKGAWRGQDRQLYLGADAIRIVQQIEPCPKGFLFPSKKNIEGFLTRLTYQRVVKKCTLQLIKNGILTNPPEWTIRGIRSGRARHMQTMHGLEAARILLGHTDQRMTSHYAGTPIPNGDFIGGLNHDIQN